MPQDRSLQVTVLRGLDPLQSIAEEWAGLWLRDPYATPFQSPQWLLPWARCFAADRLVSLAAYAGGGLVAVVPLYAHCSDGDRQRQLLFLGAGTSDYLGCTAAPEAGKDVFEAISRELLSSSGWQAACLNQIAHGSPLLQLPAMEPQFSISFSEPCFRIRLNSPQGVPAKLRGNIRYCRRRARAMGPLQFVRAHSTTQALEFFEALVTLHTRRWQALGEPGVLADPRVLAHHRAAIPLLLAGNMLRLCALRLNGEIIGCIYALADAPERAQRSFYYYLSGFDPEFHRLSPGTLLLAGLVEEARSEGAITVDLLRGDEAYKKSWRAKPVPTYSLHLAPPKPATQIQFTPE